MKRPDIYITILLYFDSILKNLLRTDDETKSVKTICN